MPSMHMHTQIYQKTKLGGFSLSEGDLQYRETEYLLAISLLNLWVAEFYTKNVLAIASYKYYTWKHKYLVS